MIDWSGIYEKYKGKWVAVLEDQETVVGNGNSLNAAQKDAAKNGYTDVFLMSVPEKVQIFVG